MRNLLVAACAAYAFSASPAFAVSGKAGAFAPFPVGARGAALAGAQTARPGVGDALFLNPAGITHVTQWNTSYQHANAYGLLPLHQVGGLWHQPNRPVWVGAAWKQSGDEVYAENEMRLGAAYRRDYMNVGATWNLRYAGTGTGGTDFHDPETGLNRRVEASALGLMGFDAGAIAHPFGPDYALGVVFHDLLSRVSWDSENEAGTAEGEYAQYLPITVRFGFYAKPDAAMAFMLDFEPSLYHDGLSRIATGIESFPMEWLPDSRAKAWVHDMVALRLGYTRNMFTQEAFHRLGLGGGFNMAYAGMALNCDIAYEWVFAFEDRNSLRFGFQLTR
jgi:hypothetical protein